MSAAFYKLDNLIVIIDRNTLQITGRTENVMALEPLAERFSAFGYAVRTVDGNDVAALVDVARAHAPLFTLRGGTNEVLRGMVAKGMGLR